MCLCVCGGGRCKTIPCVPCMCMESCKTIPRTEKTIPPLGGRIPGEATSGSRLKLGGTKKFAREALLVIHCVTFVEQRYSKHLLDFPLLQLSSLLLLWCELLVVQVASPLKHPCCSLRSSRCVLFQFRHWHELHLSSHLPVSFPAFLILVLSLCHWYGVLMISEGLVERACVV